MRKNSHFRRLVMSGSAYNALSLAFINKNPEFGVPNIQALVHECDGSKMLSTNLCTIGVVFIAMFAPFAFPHPGGATIAGICCLIGLPFLGFGIWFYRKYGRVSRALVTFERQATKFCDIIFGRAETFADEQALRTSSEGWIDKQIEKGKLLTTLSEGGSTDPGNDADFEEALQLGFRLGVFDPTYTCQRIAEYWSDRADARTPS